MPTQTQIKATIKRESANARRDMNNLDAETLAELRIIYQRAADSIRNDIAALSQGQATARLDNLQSILHQVENRITELEEAKETLLQRGFIVAIDRGTGPFSGAVDAVILNRVSESTIRFIYQFQAADGLQLSDRVWRVDREARATIKQSIQQAIIVGNDASIAAQDFLARGVPVPLNIQQNINAAAPAAIGSQVGRDLLQNESSAYFKASRVFRTEINRAHIEAYRDSAFQHPDVIGTQFLLSPNHPKQDICDMHARVNRFGLGPGVYPKGRSPLPAHPNTLSYEVVVFKDEVTQADRDGKEDRISFLKRQSRANQLGALGSEKKVDLLNADQLTERQITTPYKTLKKRIEA